MVDETRDVEKGIDRADLLGQGRNRRRVGYVEGTSLDALHLREIGQCLLVEIGGEDRGAFLGQSQGRRAADALGCRRDEGGLACHAS